MDELVGTVACPEAIRRLTSWAASDRGGRRPPSDRRVRPGTQHDRNDLGRPVLRDDDLKANVVALTGYAIDVAYGSVIPAA